MPRYGNHNSANVSLSKGQIPECKNEQYDYYQALIKRHMNPDDYDEDGNNIVPCPICMDVYCPSKEDGECPKEKEFVESYKGKKNDELSEKTG